MSDEPVAYLNGQLLPASQATIQLYDVGFIQGVTVSEQLRTFQGRLFRLEHHLERLKNSLAIIGVQPKQSFAELSQIATDVAQRNHALLTKGDDLGLAILVTPGPSSAFAPPEAPHEPTVCIHTHPVAFHTFAKQLREGQSLVTTNVRQVPSSCWPVELKCRSRMHYYLADRAARAIDPSARALMLDEHDQVTEASTANVVLYMPDEGFVSPPLEAILPGISVSSLEEIALELGYRFSYRVVKVEDVATAQEVFLTSTSPCIIPCVRLNHRPIGAGVPGATFARLMQAWSERVGVSIIEQAQEFALRRVT